MLCVSLWDVVNNSLIINNIEFIRSDNAYLVHLFSVTALLFRIHTRHIIVWPCVFYYCVHTRQSFLTVYIENQTSERSVAYIPRYVFTSSSRLNYYYWWCTRSSIYAVAMLFACRLCAMFCQAIASITSSIASTVRTRLSRMNTVREHTRSYNDIYVFAILKR